MAAISFATAAVVTKGDIKLLDPSAKSQIAKWAKSIGDGTELTIEIKERKNQRSLAQNRSLWGPIYDQILGKVMCEDYREDEINEPLETNPKKQNIHYGLLAKRFGYVIDPITKMSVPAKTSSEMTTSEMAEYFEWLVMYCADELHIEVTLPDEVR